MNQKDRKQAILKLLRDKEEPVPGSELAAYFSVTRQVIVKDIALLKAEGTPIYATIRGYQIEKKQSRNTVIRQISVCHDAESIEKELEIIVDLGGHVLSTAIEHPVYGKLGEGLHIKSRRDIQNFLAKVKATECAPLLCLTKGRHTHKIETDDEDTMNAVLTALKEAGYLLSE